MSKVKITQEQINRIESHLNTISTQESLLKLHATSGWEQNKNLCLNDLSLHDMARILYEPNSYEVEPKFKADDWVFIANEGMHNRGKFIGQVVSVNENNKSIKLDNGWSIVAHSKHLRHATPEEIATEKQCRFFDRNGRGVWELKQNDVLSGYKLSSSTVYGTNEKGVQFSELSIFKTWEDIQKNYKVVCFAEGRLDV